MIHVKDHLEHCPTFLTENLALLEEAARLARKRPGRTWEKWRRKSAGTIRDALERLCYKKCAWCESKIGATSAPEIDHYRPKQRYYWLMFTWTNLLLSCRACNTAKKLQFPLEDEANRMKSPDGDLTRERPLLIHPATEDPVEHIRFEGAMAVGLTERGKKTISILGLNSRGELFERRRDYLKIVQMLLSHPKIVGSWPEARAKLEAPGSEYSAMIRVHLERTIVEFPS